MNEMEIKTIGVAGAGVIGIGVAQALLESNYSVVLLDSEPEALEKARQGIWNGLRLNLLYGRSTADPEEISSRVKYCRDIRRLESVDYVIENITEDFLAKQQLYRQLDGICPARTIFAVNTSAIPIRYVSATVKRPQNVIGVHFMNPVPLKRTVELIRTQDTSDATVETTKGVLRAMGKDWVAVEDAPGFVSNRVLMLTLNEAISVVQERVARAEDVDRIFKECFGQQMGPLETADLIGLDTVLNSLTVLGECLKDAKFEPCELLREMVKKGRLGRKTGWGFYQYQQ